MPQPPSVEQVLVSRTPGQKSVVFGSVDVNTAVGRDDSGRLDVSRLVYVVLHQIHTIRRHAYRQHTHNA